MDRASVYRSEVPYETDLLSAQRFVYEALGLAMADVLGVATVVSRLACIPTSPASLSVKVGPGSIYKLSSLEASVWGQYLSTGGLAADTNPDHQILKQGLSRDTQVFTLTPPGTAGQSITYLIEAQFQEADDAATASQFWNASNPNAPATNNVSAFRRDICALQLKAGTAATTGSQVCPSADAGWVPVWAVTVDNGETTIVGGDIAAAPGAPFLTITGGAGTPMPWTIVNTTYTAVNGDKLIGDTTGGAFTVSAPASPSADVTNFRIKGNFATHNLTIDGNGHGWAGFANPLVLNKDYIDALILFDGTNWRI